MTKVLEFSVRTTTPGSLEEVRESVESSLSIELTEGEYDDVDAYVGTLLGMKVGLYGWGNDYLLETRIEDLRFLEAAEQARLDVVRVSEPVANMLTILGPFTWRVASEADLEHDSKFADEYERRMAGYDPSTTWLDD